MSALNARRQTIVSRLAERNAVSVSELATELGVSEVTIRTDLSFLEQMGLLAKVHGGAVKSVHPYILARRKLFVAEKERIAAMAASLVADEDTVMVEAGTTAAMVPRYLANRRNVRLVTNSVLAFESARCCPSIEVVMAGGKYNPETDSFIGEIADAAINSFNARFAFVGTDGFSVEHGITAHTIEAVQIVRRMRTVSETLVVVSDSSKFGMVGAVNVLPLVKIDTIITDSALPDKAAEELRQAGCDVVMC